MHVYMEVNPTLYTGVHSHITPPTPFAKRAPFLWLIMFDTPVNAAFSYGSSSKPLIILVAVFCTFLFLQYLSWDMNTLAETTLRSKLNRSVWMIRCLKKTLLDRALQNWQRLKGLSLGPSSRVLLQRDSGCLQLLTSWVSFVLWLLLLANSCPE